MDLIASGAQRTMTSREIKAYSTVARPGCYMSREARAGYLATINESSLHASAKRVLRWIVGFGEPVMSLGIDSIAARLPCKAKDGSTSNMSRRTIQRILRMIDDSSDDGLALLRLVQKERHGVMPCAYEIDLSVLTYINLECIAGTAAQHNKRAKGVSLAVSQGVSQGVSLEGCHIEQSDTVFIRYLNSGVSAVATERLPMGVDLSAMSRFSAKVIPFPARQRGTKAEALQGDELPVPEVTSLDQPMSDAEQEDSHHGDGCDPDAWRASAMGYAMPDEAVIPMAAGSSVRRPRARLVYLDAWRGAGELGSHRFAGQA